MKKIIADRLLAKRPASAATCPRVRYKVILILEGYNRDGNPVKVRAECNDVQVLSFDMKGPRSDTSQKAQAVAILKRFAAGRLGLNYQKLFSTRVLIEKLDEKVRV